MMTKRFATLAILLCPTLAIAAIPALPKDVSAFIEKREQCDHWRGEVDGQTISKTLERDIQRACKGTDKQLYRMKSKYQNNQSITDRLNEFEEKIEASTR